MKGTLLNAGTVVAGSLGGLLVGRVLPAALGPVAMGALGLVTLGTGLKMFGASKNVPLVAGALVLGGLLGAAVGIAPALEAVGEWVRARVGGGGSFTQGFVTASVLFCVGPMTILGCIEDGLTGRSETLRLKSTLDGVAALFLAAPLGLGGFGVLASALSVLLVQGAITLAARPLSPLRDRPAALAELTGVGGPIVAAIGLSLLEIKRLPVADYLPALVLAPGAALLLERRKGRPA